MANQQKGRRVSDEELTEWRRSVGQPDAANSFSPARPALTEGGQKSERRLRGHELREWEIWNETGELPPEGGGDSAAPGNTQKTVNRPVIRKPARQAPPTPHPPDPKMLRRLNSGRMKPDWQTDLHGMTVGEAREELSRFFAVSARAGSRLLLVITGKGTGSHPESGAAGGVLNRMLPEWLSSGPHAERIWHYCHAHPRHGGTGAYYVLLRRPKRPAERREP